MSRVVPTLVVNAGGQSKRMGATKALLPVPPAQTPLITHIIARLRPIALPNVVVIANDPLITTQVQSARLPETQISVLPDAFPGKGTLGGIGTALRLIENWALVMACDLPLVNPALCERLCHLAFVQDAGGMPRWDAVVPIVNEYEEPLHALYHARCLPALEAALAAGEMRAVSFLKSVRVRYVSESELRLIDPNLHSFINVNTPQEWAAALRLLAASTEISDQSAASATDNQHLST